LTDTHTHTHLRISQTVQLTELSLFSAIFTALPAVQLDLAF